MRKLFIVPAVLLALGLATTSAQASTIYSAGLLGSNESPANSSPASGSATLLLFDDLTTLTISVNFSGLTGPASMGHIHCCVALGGNAPVVLPFTGLPLASSGTYAQTFNLNTPGVLTGGITASAFVAGLQAGTTYVNLHTALYPAGEIRGFTVASPEPATWGLLALSLAAGFGVRFVRRTAAATK